MIMFVSLFSFLHCFKLITVFVFVYLSFATCMVNKDEYISLTTVPSKDLRRSRQRIWSRVRKFSLSSAKRPFVYNSGQCDTDQEVQHWSSFPDRLAMYSET